MTTRKCFCLGVIPALFLQAFGAYAYFVVFANTPLASPLYSAVKILLFFWPLIWLALGAPLPKFTFRITPRSALIGLACGVVMAASIFALYTLLHATIAVYAADILTKADDLFPLQYYIPVAIVFCLVHSLFEEYFWRWFVFSGLRLRMPAIAAALVGSVAFTLHHIVILSQFFPAGLTALTSFGVFIGGLIWCFLYNKTNSLAASWISHALVDGAIFAIGYVLIF